MPSWGGRNRYWIKITENWWPLATSVNYSGSTVHGKQDSLISKQSKGMNLWDEHFVYSFNRFINPPVYQPIPTSSV